MIYEHNGKRVEVVPSGKGLATVFDKDIIIYCVSKLISMRDEGRPIGPCVRLTTHDMLVATNRPTDSIGYERLEPALDRLMGTCVKTNIETGERTETKTFSLIQSYDYSRKKHGIFERLRYLEVELSNWLFRAIEANEVLAISRDYFRLRSPLDRRIYELARKHCGKQQNWRVRSTCCKKRSGSTHGAPKFTEYMRHVAAENHLPDYAMTLKRIRRCSGGEGRSGRSRLTGAEPIVAAGSRSGCGGYSCAGAAYHGFREGDRAAVRIRARLGQVHAGKPISPGPRTRRQRATRMRGFWLGEELHERQGIALTG